MGKYTPGSTSKAGDHERAPDYWCQQRGADDRFQDALRAAGMLEGADPRHGTEAPRPITASFGSPLKSSSGF